jgi:cyclic beta-1,2-glucan synthetase
MAHHQGMSLLALAYLLLDRPMQRRFESDPLFQAVMLLLQERIPRPRPCFAHRPTLGGTRRQCGRGNADSRLQHARHPTPEVQLLSNGRYHVMVTNAGGGYSRWKDFAVTRWREDGTCDNWGFLLPARRGERHRLVHEPHQPTLKRPDPLRSHLLRRAGRVSPP